MEVKAGYKETEVGMIPKDWEVLSAVEACSKIQDGTHFSPQIRGNDYFYVTSKNIRFGYLDMSTASRIDAAQHQAIYRRCDVKKGDLLLTKDGANTGNAALNILDEEFSLLSSVALLRFREDKHCSAYFLQQVLTSQGQRQIQDAMAGNAITRLTLEKIRKLRFPLPPTLAEQQAIAGALSDADALIESLEQLITKKRQVKQGAMQELLSGKRRLPGFEGEWVVKRFGEICSRLLNGGTPSTHREEFWTGTIPWISGADILDQSVGQVRRCITQEAVKNSATNVIEKGNLLVVTRTGVGKIAIAPFDIAISQDFTGVYLNYELVDTDFIFRYLDANSFLLRNLIQGTSISGITRETLTSIVLSLPPSIEEQTAIAAILSDMDAEIAVLEERLAKSRQLKQGMMQELLTGRIRLVESEELGVKNKKLKVESGKNDSGRLKAESGK